MGADAVKIFCKAVPSFGNHTASSHSNEICISYDAIMLVFAIYNTCSGHFRGIFLRKMSSYLSTLWILKSIYKDPFGKGRHNESIMHDEDR